MEKQTINIKNTYVATVKNDVSEKALKFYSNNNNALDNGNIFVDESVFPSVSEEKKEEVNVTIPAELNIKDNENVSLESNDTNIAIDNKVEVPVQDSVVLNNDEPVPPLENPVNVSDNNEKESIVVPEQTIQSTPVEEKIAVPEIPNLNVLEAATNQSEVVNPQPIPPVPEVTVSPEPIPSPEAVPPVATPMAMDSIDQMVNTVSLNNDGVNTTPVFDASHETNLLGALAENNQPSTMGNVTVTPDNLNAVRDFGVDEPITDQNTVSASRPSMGFVNSKILLVVVVLFFLASCVFLGYEIYKYFTLPK